MLIMILKSQDQSFSLTLSEVVCIFFSNFCIMNKGLQSILCCLVCFTNNDSYEQILLLGKKNPCMISVAHHKLMMWFFLVAKNIQHDQCSPIHKQMTLMNQFFLVNQKHAARSVYSDSQINDSNELVLFSGLKTYSCVF